MGFMERYLKSFGFFSLATTLLFVVGVCFLPAHSHADTVNDLEILTENFAPFNFYRDGKIQGISVDLLHKILKRTGATKSRKDFRVLPWTRGYRTALQIKNTILFTTARSKTRETLFKWVGPIIKNRSVLIAKKARNIRIKDKDDLNRYIIGVVVDDAGEQNLLQAGVSHKNIYRTVSETGGANLGKMLAADRIDLWAYGEITAFWNLKESGFLPEEYEVVYVLQESEAYFALNKDTDDMIVSQLQRALDAIRNSGEFNTVVQNYLPDYSFVLNKATAMGSSQPNAGMVKE